MKRLSAALLALSGCGPGVDLAVDQQAMHCDRGHNPHCEPDAGTPLSVTLGADAVRYVADYGVFVSISLGTSRPPIDTTWVVNVFAPGELPWLASTVPVGTPYVFGLYPGAPQGTWRADGYVDGAHVVTSFEVGP